MISALRPQAPASAEEQQQQQEQQQAAEEQRSSMLAALLQPAARERRESRGASHAPGEGLAGRKPARRRLPCLPAVARIALVKPEKARGVEDIIIHAAKRGQIQEKVSEDRLIELLEQVNERTQQKAKVTFQRRAFDDDW